jgi:prepilin-type N-terminal cleavage/methylation domain-containing protein
MKRGFTIIEIIISIGILSIMGSFGLFIGLDFYRNYRLAEERDLVVSLLQRARNLAQENIGNLPHGIYFGANEYVLFEGLAYNPINPLNEKFDIGLGVGHSVNQNEIVFSKLSGNANFSGNINLVFGSKTLSISVNNYGQIN